MKAARSTSGTVASQVGDAAGGVAEAGSELASSAREHARTLASRATRAWRGAIHSEPI